MKHHYLTVLLLLFAQGILFAQQTTSPDKNVILLFELQQGRPTYNLSYKGHTVIESSALGLEAEGIQLSGNFEITDTIRSSFDETWTPVWGEYASIRNNYNEMAVSLMQPDTKRRMTIRFRLFNDGLGFRYEFPDQPHLHNFIISDEITEFRLTGNHTAFCIPGDYDSNEFAYTTAPLSDIEKGMQANLRFKNYESRAEGTLTVQTPLMLKSAEGLYINIHEAALVHYAGMLLNVDAQNFVLNAHLTPDKLGKKGYMQTPCQSPWRTVIVSDDARDILASQTILNLNEPCTFKDVSWIKPTKFMGVWWEMFIGTGRTWAYCDNFHAQPGTTDYSLEKPNGRHAANTDNVKRYIDFAADNGIGALLVEGWNEGWEDWGSYKKDHHFDFCKPYPDFALDSLLDYAHSKGVDIIMHHETAANAADYERQLDKAFQFMADHGYHAVKTGYVGYVIPRSEYHSSQWMNDHYIHVAQRAADYKIMIDSHEAVRPTGLCRTYPNWMAQESARGGEFESMGGNAPDHTTILPFTRLMGGPMDYTPGILQTELAYYKGEKNDRVGTTLAHQLALYLTMPSPIQMAADLPENYARFADAFQFIRDVAVDWDNSWYLEAEPGDYITVARKTKGKDEWFIGAITDENARTADIHFNFLPAGNYMATIYEDGKKAGWNTLPMDYNIRKLKVTPKTKIKQKLTNGGGVAISIKPIK